MASRFVLLDTGVLGMVTHPKGNNDVKTWLQKLLTTDTIVFIPEICDYEIRRELLRAGKTHSIIRLDTLKIKLRYLPINTNMMLKAAEFWAETRKRGMPTTDDKALDADVILAAQANILSGVTGVNPMIATTNVRHLSRFVQAERWWDII
jgi:predicted nucleic acid-binding protein